MDFRKVAGMLVLAVSVSNAAVIPGAGQVVTSAGLTPIRTRVADRIAYASTNGYHYVSVDMDGINFKQEKELMKELQGQGYRVDFCNDRHVFGWNSLNGGLLIRWK